MKLLYKFCFLLFFLCLNSLLFAQSSPTITCDSVLQTSTCVGGTLIVRFSVSGGSYNNGNVFTAQLSKNGGSFSKPVNIGSTTFSFGYILATIPANTNIGVYKVRVITSSPADTSNASPNYILVTQVAQLNRITSSPHNSVCNGDTITLTDINIASTYSWSNGDTTKSIKVSAPGVYSVTTIDGLTCKSSTTDTVSSICTGIDEISSLENEWSIYPNPSIGEFNVSLNLLSGNAKSLSVIGFEIYNVIGEKVYASGINQQLAAAGTIEGRNETIHLNVPNGIYFVRAHTNKGNTVKKIVISR
jgi:hypothetical protein